MTVAELIGTLLEVPCAEGVDPEAIAAGSAAIFAEVEGLWMKLFTVSPGTPRVVRNFYVWSDEAVGRAFFTAERLLRIAEVYGGEPSLTWLGVPVVVVREEGRPKGPEAAPPERPLWR